MNLFSGHSQRVRTRASVMPRTTGVRMKLTVVTCSTQQSEWLLAWTSSYCLGVHKDPARPSLPWPCGDGDDRWKQLPGGGSYRGVLLLHLF